MSESERCLHRRVEVIEPKDGLVAERETCRDCGETLSIRLLYPPGEKELMKVHDDQWPRLWDDDA